MTSLRVPVGDASTGFRAIRKETADKMRLHGSCLCGTFVLEAARNGARVKGVSITVPRGRMAGVGYRPGTLSSCYTCWDVLRF